MNWILLVLVIYIGSPWALCPAPLTAKDVVADHACVDYGQKPQLRCIDANGGHILPTATAHAPK